MMNITVKKINRLEGSRGLICIQVKKGAMTQTTQMEETRLMKIEELDFYANIASLEFSCREKNGFCIYEGYQVIVVYPQDSASIYVEPQDEHNPVTIRKFLYRCNKQELSLITDQCKEFGEYCDAPSTFEAKTYEVNIIYIGPVCNSCLGKKPVTTFQNWSFGP